MKYIITSIQYNAPVNKNLLANMLNFAKEQGVEKVFTFVMKGMYIEEDLIDTTIGNLIAEDVIEPVSNSFKLNANLRVYDTKILPSQINPTTGLNRKLSRDYSYILPSPKIRYESIANTTKYPRAVMTTGCLTKPNYKTSQAHGKKAEEMHQYGFVFVEIVNNQIFKAYQIEATNKGDFQHLTKKYHSGVIVKQQPEALVLGDWHTGDTDLWVRKESLKMIKELNPKRVVFHDLFNGHSVNHHEKDQLLSQLRNFKDKRVSLQDEMTAVYKEICFFAKQFPETQFLVVRSNHDDFLEKYIQHKMFMYDTQNFLFTCRIIASILDARKIPLKEALALIGEIPKNFTFLQQDECYRIEGIELGMHGHLGANGSKGSPNQFNALNLKTITGHTHSPKLLENAMVVGTSTHLKLGYTHGPSAWLNAHGILYSNGKYSLLTLLK